MQPAGFLEPIIHVDMDAFFVEVERLRRPELRDAAVAVGGSGPRGVVASASYEAREFGVRSAMPVSRAARLCPRLVVVPPDHSEYRRVSSVVFEVLRRFSPYVEGLSIDEAFLDIGGLRRQYREAADVAQAVREAIRSEPGLPSSAGVAPNKLLAKLASQEAKPDGLVVVPADGVAEFLDPLPVRRLWGVGEATHAQLERFGVKTIGDLVGVPIATLEQRLGATMGRHLHDLSLGIDDRPVASPGEAKSVSVEVTYDSDLEDFDRIEAEILRQSERVADRLRRANIVGRTVTLKIRFGDFKTITRTRTLDSPTSVGRDIYRVARDLLSHSDVGGRPVRLIGIGLSTLQSGGSPVQLAADRPAAWDDLAEAVADARGRFGVDAVKPARLIDGEKDKT